MKNAVSSKFRFYSYLSSIKRRFLEILSHPIYIQRIFWGLRKKIEEVKNRETVSDIVGTTRSCSTSRIVSGRNQVIRHKSHVVRNNRHFFRLLLLPLPYRLPLPLLPLLLLLLFSICLLKAWRASVTFRQTATPLSGDEWWMNCSCSGIVDRTTRMMLYSYKQCLNLNKNYKI